jgi:enoyl-CoA hydratase/carnithine racemase
MAFTTLEIKRDGPVTWCTLNRPDSLNALSRQLVEDLHGFYDELARDTETRVVVLRGAGRAFCAGLDLKEGAGGGERGDIGAQLRGQHRIAELSIKMRRLAQVFVALVHGPACGGGFMLALASDIRIAGESTRMNAAFIKLGLSGCDVGVSYLLPRLTNASVAAELILTGRFIHAERARELGLVSQVVADDQLESTGRLLIEDLLLTSPLGLRLSKEALNASLDMNSIESVVSMEDRNQILAAQSSDFREGIRAFLEKRKPVWGNRA